MSCEKNCDKCNPGKCQCHPCYDVSVGMTNDCLECNDNTAQPVNTCDQPTLCTEGCEEFIPLECVTGLLEAIDILTTQINIIQENCCNESPNTCGEIIGTYNCQTQMFDFTDYSVSYTIVIDLDDGVIISPTSTHNFTNTEELIFNVVYFTTDRNCPTKAGQIIIPSCVNCNEITDPFFEIGCEGGVVVEGSNISYVTIEGVAGQFQDGDDVIPALTSGTYNITFHPVDENCGTVTSNYTLSCP